MKRLGLFLGLLFIVTQSFAFEGVIHCTKTQNGITTSFDFYVKGDQISIIAKDGTSDYRILLNRAAKELRLCISTPEFSTKGYYLYTESDIRKNSEIEVLSQSRTDAIEIDGSLCEGHTIVTDRGIAMAYFGSDEVDITGFSAFFNDPVYELLDALDSKYLPRKLVVNKSTGSYSIDLKAEAQSIDDSYFQVPTGYEKFEVSYEGQMKD